MWRIVPLNMSCFQQKCKGSTVMPIPKFANTTKCKEFKSVTTVPSVQQMMELAVKYRLLNFYDKNSVIVPNHTGFRNQHSCESLITNVTSG